jgi:predicted DNA-binding ArsR family transcriptional regulator
MSKSNFNKKMMISVAGAALLSIGFAGVSGQENAMSATTVSAKAAKNKVVGVNSAIYKKAGKKAVKTSAIVRAGSRVTTYGKKTIKGVTYYEIGKGQYIKAANVDGKSRKLAKSTYLYTRSGKTIKGSKMVKGKKVRTFGKAITIHGKKFYATKRGYIPAKALAVKQAPVDDITPTNPATPTTTTTPSANNSTQTPSSTTNIINGGGTSNSNGSNINPPADRKELAVQEINKIANNALDILGKSKEAKEEVSKAEDEVKQAVNDAETVIKNGDLSSEEIDQITTQTFDKINDVASHFAKDEADEDIENAVMEARNGFANAAAPIDADKAIDAVEQTARVSKTVIEEAKTISEIDQIKTQTVNTIKNIESNFAKKDVTVVEIDKTAKDAKDALNKLGKSKEEVSKAEDEVKQAVNDAETVINKADLSSEEIDQIKTQTLDKINGIVSGLAEKTK